MSDQIKDIELKIKLAQLDKLKGQLVSKDTVRKQFVLYNSLLWNMIDNAIINIATILSSKAGVNFEYCVNLLRDKLYQIKDSIEGDIGNDRPIDED